MRSLPRPPLPFADNSPTVAFAGQLAAFLAPPPMLRFLPPHLADASGAIGRVRNEVRIARNVGYPDVCRVLDIGRVGRHSVISMEDVEGEDLRSAAADEAMARDRSRTSKRRGSGRRS